MSRETNSRGGQGSLDNLESIALSMGTEIATWLWLSGVRLQVQRVWEKVLYSNVQYCKISRHRLRLHFDGLLMAFRTQPLDLHMGTHSNAMLKEWRAVKTCLVVGYSLCCPSLKIPRTSSAPKVFAVNAHDD
jgi:hypothetical protein